jgi:hypothetical protein
MAGCGGVGDIGADCTRHRTHQRRAQRPPGEDSGVPRRPTDHDSRCAPLRLSLRPHALAYALSTQLCDVQHPSTPRSPDFDYFVGLGLGLVAHAPAQLVVDRTFRAHCADSYLHTNTHGAGKPACVEVFATAVSPAKETLMNIDVFGRIYDANGANALDRVRLDLSSHCSICTSTDWCGEMRTELTRGGGGGGLRTCVWVRIGRRFGCRAHRQHQRGGAGRVARIVSHHRVTDGTGAGRPAIRQVQGQSIPWQRIRACQSPSDAVARVVYGVACWRLFVSL